MWGGRVSHVAGRARSEARRWGRGGRREASTSRAPQRGAPAAGTHDRPTGCLDGTDSSLPHILIINTLVHIVMKFLFFPRFNQIHPKFTFESMYVFLVIFISFHLVPKITSSSLADVCLYSFKNGLIIWRIVICKCEINFVKIDRMTWCLVSHNLYCKQCQIAARRQCHAYLAPTTLRKIHIDLIFYLCW